MKNARPAPRPPVVALALLLVLLAPLLSGRARPAAAPPDVQAFFDRVTAAWSSRRLDEWLALWEFASPEARADERSEAQAAFGSDETAATRVLEPIVSADGRTAELDVQLFVAQEPRGRVSYSRLTARRRDDGWVLVGRRQSGDVEGLVHLGLAEQAWRARDVRVRLEDLELHLRDGTLYTTHAAVGRTALVFIGDARVRFAPRPAAEREQLRQFSGATSIDEAAKWVFVRLHPGDFPRVVDGSGLLPEPQPERHREAAERIFRARTPRSYMVETPLPRSPWWLLPSPGDAVVDFPWRGGHVLSYALAPGEAEDVNLFDRDRRLQVCSYASAGRAPRSGADGHGPFDVVDQELTIRLEPERREILAAHSMRVRLREPVPTLRLRLADDLRVSSVSTAEGAALLFFRIREQSALVVSLGAHASNEVLTIVTRYTGRHDPAPVEDEIAQVADISQLELEASFVEEPPLVYSNRTSWYPRPSSEDFATATFHFDTPAGWLAVTGGDLVSVRTEARRTQSEFRLKQPGKYMTAIVGRFAELGMRQQGEQAVRGYATTRVRSDALERMALAEEMLAFYARTFGPSPYPSLGFVLAEGRTPGGHSPPGLVYLQERPPVLQRGLADDPANFSDVPGFFLAHELAHQWWGQGTAPLSYRDRWLSEGWAQYAAALWVRDRLGEPAFQRMMDRMARWARRHDDKGPIDLGQRLGSLRRDPRIFRAVVYDKGAWVLHMLRGIVGDRVFFQAARDFLQRQQYGKASSLDMQRAFEAASGRDLSPYFERWVFGTGVPHLRWAARTEPGTSSFRTTVDVSSEALPGPVPLEIALVGEDGRTTHRVELAPSGGSWSFDSRTAPRRVVLNEDRGLLARIEAGRPRPPARVR